MSNEFGILELNILHNAMTGMVENAIKDRERFGEDTLGTVEKYTELRDKVHTMLEAKCDEADKAFAIAQAGRMRHDVAETAKGLGCNDDEVAFFVSILD